MAAGARRAGWDTDECPLSDGGEGFAEVLAAAPRPPGGDAGARGADVTVTGPLGSPVRARWWLAGDDGGGGVGGGLGVCPWPGGPRATTRWGPRPGARGSSSSPRWRRGPDGCWSGVGGSATTDGGRGAIEAIERGRRVSAPPRWWWPATWRRCSCRPRRSSAPRRGPRRTRWWSWSGAWSTTPATWPSATASTSPPWPGRGRPEAWPGAWPRSGARLVPGFGVVAEAVGLEARLARAQVVVTGEGRLDASSWSGKVVGSVVGMARRAGVPVLVVPGAVGPGGLEPVAGAGAGGGPGRLGRTVRWWRSAASPTAWARRRRWPIPPERRRRRWPRPCSISSRAGGPGLSPAAGLSAGAPRGRSRRPGAGRRRGRRWPGAAARPGAGCGGPACPGRPGRSGSTPKCSATSMSRASSTP